MDGSAEFGSGTGILTRANAGGTVHKRAAVLRAVLGMLNAIGTHFETGAANRDSIGADGEIVFVGARSAAFRVEINKRRNILFAAILVNSHSVMSGVEEECGNLKAGQKSLHGEEALEEAQGIMAGSGVKQGKNRQIAERIRGGEQVEAVTVVVAASMRVPADIAVRLGVIAVAVTVGNPQLPAIAQAFLPLLGGGNDGSAVARKGQSVRVYETPLDRFLQKQLLKHLEEEGEGLLPGRRGGLELGKQLANCEFIYRSGLFSLLLWLAWPGFRRMFVRSKVVFMVQPQTREEIIKGSYAGGIARFKSADDRVSGNKLKLIDLEFPQNLGWWKIGEKKSW